MQSSLTDSTLLISWHLSKNELTACLRKNAPMLLITGAGWGDGSEMVPPSPMSPVLSQPSIFRIPKNYGWAALHTQQSQDSTMQGVNYSFWFNVTFQTVQSIQGLFSRLSGAQVITPRTQVLESSLFFSYLLSHSLWVLLIALFIP